LKWIVKRLLLALFTIYFVITITFFLIRLMPGDFIEMMVYYYMTTWGMSEEEARMLVYGMYGMLPDEPLWMQYLRYIWGLLRGYWGKSYISRLPVTEALIVTREGFSPLAWTVYLLSVSMTISFALGVFLGILMGYKRGSIFDNAASTFASISRATPNFILGLLLLYFFTIEYPIFPSRGSYDINIEPGFTIEFISSVLYHSFLPMMAYVITSVGGWMLAMRSSSIRVLGEDYVVVAEARGLKHGRIARTYVGRNAILPLFASFAISLGYMFGGSVFIESYFAYSGIGHVIGLALSWRDYPLIQGGFLLITTAVVISNLIADLLYGKLDPRIRVGGAHA